MLFKAVELQEPLCTPGSCRISAGRANFALVQLVLQEKDVTIRTFLSSKMARIPSWTELCMIVDELSRTQKECYDSVHRLLDPGIPDLDRKIRYLVSKPNEIPVTSTNSVVVVEPTRPNHVTPTRPKAPAITKVTINDTAPLATNIIKKTIATQPAPIVETIPMPTATNPPVTKKSHAISQINTLAAHVEKNIIPVKTRTHRANGTTKNGMTNGHKMSIKDLEHLRAPRLPLSEYLRKNRPDILLNVEARSSYIRKISEERKSQRAYRILSSLERIRISSRTRKSSHRNQYQRIDQRPMRAMKNLDAPDYCVRHKQSEREMKQLTLRNYKRLPEVKKQKLEEVNKHLKEQYYKNRQLYGRMLLNNFKNGIINYPLRASYDDRSITSSQSEYSVSRSAETACSLDPYY